MMTKIVSWTPSLSLSLLSTYIYLVTTQETISESMCRFPQSDGQKVDVLKNKR